MRAAPDSRASADRLRGASVTILRSCRRICARRTRKTDVTAADAIAALSKGLLAAKTRSGPDWVQAVSMFLGCSRPALSKYPISRSGKGGRVV